MTTIQETVQTVLRDQGQASYMSYAMPVIEALEAREQEISDKLIEYATAELDEDVAEVRDKLTELGLTLPEPRVVGVPEGNGNGEGTGDVAEVLALVRSMSTQVNSLTEFARANGYRG